MTIINRTTGMRSTQADENPSLVVLKHRNISNTKLKYKVGDKVRISVIKRN